MAKFGFGIDFGATSIKLIEGRESGGGFEITHAVSVPVSPDHDLGAEIKRALSWKPKSKKVVVGITGRDVMMRYSQVPQVPEWQLREMMDFEVQEIRSQSGEDLAADYNLLPISSEYSDDDIALLTLAKEGYLAPLREAIEQAGLSLAYFIPDSIALYNVFAKAGPDVQGITMLLNIGSKGSDIAILKDHDLIFARNISTGGEAFDDALVKQFNISDSKAESLKRQMGDVRPRDQRSGQTPQQAKVSTALEGTAGQFFSMVRSTMMLAKTQLKVQELNLDRVYISGGTSALTGLADYLSSSLSVPVEVFDAFDVVEVDSEDEVDEISLAATPAVGLAMSAVFDDVYSLEVLGEKERKKRQFQNGTLYSLLAIFLVVVYLGFDAYKSRENYNQAKAQLVKVNSQRTKLSKNEKRFEKRVEERTDLGEKVSQLESWREGALGLFAVKRAVEKYLPSEFWVTSMSVDSQMPPGVEGTAKRPAVVVEGAGKESQQGISLVTIFDEFCRRIDQEPGIEAVLPQPGTATPFEFRLTVFPSKFGGESSEDTES